MQHLDVSSFLGPASMVERWVRSTTRRRGAIGGEFLQQGFAYKQSGGRERGATGRLALGGEGVGGWCAPSPLYIEGWADATLAPSPKPNRRPQRGGVGGKETPPSRRSISSLNLSWPAGPYGALCPWPNAARTLPHRPMPPPGRWGHVGPLPEGSRSFRYNTD